MTRVSNDFRNSIIEQTLSGKSKEVPEEGTGSNDLLDEVMANRKKVDKERTKDLDKIREAALSKGINLDVMKGII